MSAWTRLPVRTSACTGCRGAVGRRRWRPSMAQPGSGSAADDEMTDMAGRILQQDPEVRDRLDRIAAAAEKVAELQKQSAEIEMEIIEVRKRGAEEERRIAEEADRAGQRVLDRLADITVAQAEQRMRAAELAVQEAQASRTQIEASARSDAERVESVKAALVAAVGGTLGSLPYVVTSGTGPGAVAGALIVAMSCFLFGPVWRYAVREDLENPHLRSGVVGAFGIVRGLSEAQDTVSQVLGGGDRIGAVVALAQVGESMLTFLFAAAALEFAVKKGAVRLFGSAGSLLD